MLNKIGAHVKENFFQVSFSLIFTTLIECWLFNQLEVRNYQGFTAFRFDILVFLSIPLFFVFSLFVLQDVEKFKANMARTARYLSFFAILLPIGIHFSFFHMVLFMPFAYFAMYKCYAEVKKSYRKTKKLTLGDFVILGMIPGFIIITVLVDILNLFN